MLITIRRHWFTDKSTIGVLEVDGIKAGFTLEDVARADGVKIPKITAIPAGSYDVTINYSQRFMRRMPLIQDIPNFTGVRIHKGNGPQDVEGCIAVGLQRGPDTIWDCTGLFDWLFDKIDTALKQGDKVSLVILNEQI